MKGILILIGLLLIGGYVFYSKSKKKEKVDYESIESNTPDGNCSAYCKEDFATGEVSCQYCKVPNKSKSE